jgi:hypothetical protein
MNTGQYALTLTSPHFANGEIRCSASSILLWSFRRVRAPFSASASLLRPWGRKNDTLIIVNNGTTEADTVVLHAVSADGNFAMSRPAVLLRRHSGREFSKGQSLYQEHRHIPADREEYVHTDPGVYLFTGLISRSFPETVRNFVITFASGPEGVKRDTIAMATDIYNTPSYYLPLSGNSIASRFALILRRSISVPCCAVCR